MHPVLFQMGNFAFPTYGLFAVLAFIIGMLVVRRYAVIEGLDRRQMTDAIFYTIIAGFVGARALEVIINWERFVADPRTVLLSVGVFMGGLIAALAFAVFWLRRIDVPVLAGLDIVALVLCIAMGVGRWGCFASGCCWGTPSDLPWAVVFPDAARLIHAGLPGVPVHPTQIYLSLNSLAILGILALVYRRKRFHGRIIMLYLMLYGVTRFVLEYFRGDAVRRFVIEDVLSTSQFLSILVVVAAAFGYSILARRHRASGAPDWMPAALRDAEPVRGKSGRRPASRGGKASKRRR